MSEASRAWSWRHAFSASSLPATTKHVLHTLGMFMNELGEGCYPSVADICRYSGLDKKTVLKHLAGAREAGWIVVAQHGYRGQKWKRNEYAARWPERDLVAPCLPFDDEGGGAAPPPSPGEKAVESAPEGGGTEGSKVVEDVHQDKTSPETTPETSPVEREAREDPKKIEEAFWRMVRVWPGQKGLPTDRSLRVFSALSAEERADAERMFPHWLALLKAQKKDHVHAPFTYFGQKLWRDVPEPADEKPTTIVAPPFGPVWSAMRLRSLLLTAPAEAPPAKGFMAALLAQDDAKGRQARLTRQAAHGWPQVNRMHEAAESRRGITVAAELDALAALMEPVPVGSELYQRWLEEHERRGWPWLPDPGLMPVVYFPVGGPDGLEAFEQALRGNHDARQAAE